MESFIVYIGKKLLIFITVEPVIHTRKFQLGGFHKISKGWEEIIDSIRPMLQREERM